MVFSKLNDENIIYYVSSYKLWVMNTKMDNSAVKAYAENSGASDKCPHDLPKWKKMDSIWKPMPSAFKITCASRIWAQWTECSCSTLTRVCNIYVLLYCYKYDI